MTLLGRTVGHPITAEALETWEVAKNVSRVTYVTEELQALCPVTGQPDIYAASITWFPDSGQTIESKGMKHYLWSYRDLGVSCEDLAADIAHDLTTRLGTDVTVTLTQQVRGGLSLTATAIGARHP